MMTEKLFDGTLIKYWELKTYLDAAVSTGLIPETHALEGIQDNIQQNGEDVIRLRYTRAGRESFYFDDHFSIVIRKQDKLILGFVDLRQENAVTADMLDSLPSESEMPELVKGFFDKWDSDYLNELDDYAYRSPYGENILIDGKTLAVAGTEWKWYAPETDDWRWVVFGKKRQPIIFERNIRWTNGRTTEKWLHDSYLQTGSLDLVPVKVSKS